MTPVKTISASLLKGYPETDLRPCANTTGKAPSAPAVQIVLLNDFAETRRLGQEITSLLAVWEYNQRDRLAVRLALDEALVNAVKHGNQMDDNKQVHVAYRITDDRIEITIEDEGPGFDPDDLADPLAVENLERPCGRGLLLMRHYMTAVEFHPPGNKVTLTKLRSQAVPAAPATAASA
jgi:serine/threonine-protein kinase RsbW